MLVHRKTSAQQLGSRQAWSGFRALGIAFLLCASAGCAKNDELASVDGIVRLDGKPLTNGIVSFVPTAGRSASGAIGSDGTFRLGTFGKSDGALIGIHRVTITATATPKGPPNFDVDRPAIIPKDLVVPIRYASAATSELSFDVKPDERNRFEIDLSSQ